MDSNSERNFQDAFLSGAPGYMDGCGLVGHPSLCTRCRRSLAPEYEVTFDIEPFGLYGDCKNSHRRRTTRRRRRNWQSSFVSIEKLFSRRFSHMSDLARHNQSTLSGLENQIMDGGSTARSKQHSSSRTSTSGSRRCRRDLSDSESDGFDNLNSVYRESESDVSSWGRESDASVDGVGHSSLDIDIFVEAGSRSDISSDTDIDPMHAELNQWNSDESQEDEGDEDGEWEEGEDYEEGKQHVNNGMETHEIQLQDASEDSSSDEAEADESCQLSARRSQEVPHLDPTISSSAREGGRDWLFHAAGILGVVLMLWLGKPRIGRRRGSTSHCDLHS